MVAFYLQYEPVWSRYPLCIRYEIRSQKLHERKVKFVIQLSASSLTSTTVTTSCHAAYNGPTIQQQYLLQRTSCPQLFDPLMLILQMLSLMKKIFVIIITLISLTMYVSVEHPPTLLSQWHRRVWTSSMIPFNLIMINF